VIGGLFVHEPARNVPILHRVEVAVLGGGPAGIAAAIAAARLGRATLLVERYGFLGGMGTIAQVTSFCGLYASVGGHRMRVVGGVVDDLLERLRTAGALAEPHPILGRTWGQAYDTAAYKCVLDDLTSLAGVRLALHALAVGCVVETRPKPSSEPALPAVDLSAPFVNPSTRVAALLLETKSGRGAIVADQFVDCSGDADLAHWAGAVTEKGGPGGALAYPTLMFRLGHVDGARALEQGKPNLGRLMDAAAAGGEFHFPRRSAYINPQPHEGEWRANVTQIARDGRAVDGTSAEDLSWGELEGRRQVRAFHDFLRARVPGFERAYLLDVAPQLGIRETRRVVGEYQLTAEDVLRGRDFDDAIGLAAWPLEKHVRGDTEWTFPDGRAYFGLPLRMLIPRGMANLVVAGRCASATHDAQASVRVSGPCFAMGQAAGTLAALRCAAGSEAAGVAVERVRAELARTGAVLALRNG
jgi:hypothetical protein